MFVSLAADATTWKAQNSWSSPPTPGSSGQRRRKIQLLPSRRGARLTLVGLCASTPPRPGTVPPSSREAKYRFLPAPLTGRPLPFCLAAPTSPAWLLRHCRRPRPGKKSFAAVV